MNTIIIISILTFVLNFYSTVFQKKTVSEYKIISCEKGLYCLVPKEAEKSKVEKVENSKDSKKDEKKEMKDEIKVADNH